MVNKHGRSRGCRTCVKRKVKCDEGRPDCLRCTTTGFCCAGYKELTFINATNRMMDSQDEHEAGRISRMTASAQAPPYRASRAIAISRSKAEFRQIKNSARHLELSVISSYLSVLQDETYILYALTNLCSGPLGAVYGNCLPFRLDGLSPQQTMMNNCLLALAKVYTGLQTHQSRVSQDGLRLYGQGLLMLNDILDKAKGRITTEIIVSVISLSLGESMLPSSPSSWIAHILGLEHLFVLRGPMTVENSSLLDRALLERYRPIMILGAFFTQRPSAMCREEWKATTLPLDRITRPDWFSISDESPDLSFLTDVLAQLPALFRDRTKLLQRREKTIYPQKLETQVWTKIVQLLHSLQTWKRRWDGDHPSQIHSIALAAGVSRCRWSTVFEFEHVQIANAFAVYHATVILLTSVPLTLRKAGLQPPFTNARSTSFDESRLIADIETSADSICRSLEHHVQLLLSSPTQRDFHVFFPAHVARRSLINMGRLPQLEWLDDALALVFSETGLGMWANMEISEHLFGDHEGLFS